MSAHVSPVDLNASYYTENSALQNNHAMQLLRNFQINPDAHALDVGCGDGRITAELAKLVPQGSVLGIDAAPGMIEFASRNFASSNLQFLHSTAEEAQLPEQKYDAVVSFSCFHWLKDPASAIRRLSSSLKPGGSFLVLTYPKESPYYQYLQAALKHYPEYDRLSSYHTMLAIKDYRTLFAENNLEIVDFQQQHLVASYENTKSVTAFIKGWLNSYVPLPEELQDPFLQRVDQIVDTAPELHVEEMIDIPYTALVIQAKKI